MTGLDYEKSERLQICSSKMTWMRVEVGFSVWMVASWVFLLMILWFFIRIFDIN